MTQKNTSVIANIIKRIKWPTSAEMNSLIDRFVDDFSQAHFDFYETKMDEIDAEEFALIIKQKLIQINDK